MEIEYKGASAVTIKTNQAIVSVDPMLSIVGLKDLKVEGAVEIVTEPRFAVHGGEKILISGPGEYEVSSVAIKGIAAQRQLDESGTNTTIYSLVAAGFRIGVIGHISEKLSDDQLESLGIIDILIIPVGGSGYTLDSHGAVKLIRQISPKVVIPTHYADSGVTYEVPQNELELFTKELAATSHDVLDKYKVKAGASLPEVLTLIELKRS